jgi:hypothetical protein
LANFLEALKEKLDLIALPRRCTFAVLVIQLKRESAFVLKSALA